jgi:NitT/TauT family transport system ATP-binding protein
MGSDPGHVRAQIKIELPRPRDVDSLEVRTLIDEVYGLMTMRPVQEAKAGVPAHSHLGYRLPVADVGRMEAILDLVADAPFEGRADLPQLAEEAELSDEELFPAYEALGLLGLAQVEKGDIALTALGRRYVEADQPLKQQIFGQQLVAHVPLAAHIRHSLEQEPSGALPEKRFLDLLEEFLKTDEVEQVLKVAVEWGRYGEVYEYDYHTGRLHLPEGEDEPEEVQI